jgi:hypothetical protein
VAVKSMGQCGNPSFLTYILITTCPIFQGAGGGGR